ncbi:MAG TPA: hypothetical protein VFE05_07790 [Longimicrobiaceae bacterium]|jgi:photosystem II stability/assembly factor-like uncharacterized protein|nr:hypothetical protein [Longimicrobiaceae bacterium]
MTPFRSFLCAGAAMLALAPAVAAQQGGATPRDTAGALHETSRQGAQQRDTAAARQVQLPTDPVSQAVRGFTLRNLGPAAYSGRVTSIAVPRTYRKTIYVGTAGGGLWKTSNAGTTWQPVGDSLGTSSIGDVAVAASDSNTVWVGTGEKNSLRSQFWGNGVHVSNDGGKTWRHAGLANTRSIGRVVIHPRDPNTVYVAALGHLWGPGPDRGIYKTTDAGRTWSKVLFVNDTTGFVDLEMDPQNPEVLYAASWHRLRWGGSHMEGVGAGSGIWKTADGGRTWTRLTDPRLRNGLPTDRMGRIGLSVSPQDPRTVYAMISVDRGVSDVRAAPFGGMFRSDDAGATWRQVNDLAANPHYYYDDAWVDPTNKEHVWMTASPLLESKDGGRSFEPDSLSRVHVDNHALWIDPADPQHLVLGNDGGVYVSWDNGKAWEHMPMPIGQFYTVAVDSSQVPYRVCGGLQDNGVWCGPSATRDTLGITDADWYPVNGGDGMWVQVPAHDPYTVYSEYQFGTVSRVDLRTGKRDDLQPVSLDAGALSGYELRWGWTAPLVLSQHDTSVLWLGSNHLIRMRNRGEDWEVVGPDMTRADRTRPEPETGSTAYHALFAIAESPRRADVMWTGSDDGLVWVSRDGARTWTNVTGRFPRGAPTRCFVSSIAPSNHADGTAYLAYDCHHRDDYAPHVYRTTDFGQSWTDIGRGLPADGGSLTVFEDSRNPSLVWVGTATGAYVTLDAGRGWRRFGKNLPPVPVMMFGMSNRQRDLVLATHGRGMWTVNVTALEALTDSVVGAKAQLFPVPPALQYRYVDTYPSFGSHPFVAPNPPRGAQVTYWLKDAQPGTVDLTVTDAQGNAVRHLTGPGYAGIQRVTWDLSRDKPRPRRLGDPTDNGDLRRVDPGEYTVTLEVAGRKMQQKIVVTDWPQTPYVRLR